MTNLGTSDKELSSLTATSKLTFILIACTWQTGLQDINHSSLGIYNVRTDEAAPTERQYSSFFVPDNPYSPFGPVG